MELDAVIDACQQAHRSLRMTLGRIDEGDARRPSHLPGWTVGHVLTHLARSAESHIRILEGALAGEHLEQYEGGSTRRASDIEVGAQRTETELVDEVISSYVALEATWERMTPEAWDGHGLSGGVTWPCRHLPYFRWREVEVHHVDLGLGFDPVDWPAQYVDQELPLALIGLDDRLEDRTARAHLLAWLLGRRNQPSELTLAPWQHHPDSYLLPGP